MNSSTSYPKRRTPVGVRDRAEVTQYLVLYLEVSVVRNRVHVAGVLGGSVGFAEPDGRCRKRLPSQKIKQGLVLAA